MTDERAERLRRKRNQSNDANLQQKSRQEENSERESQKKVLSQEIEEDASENPEANTQPQSSTSVKEERIGTYMYLPESQTKDLRRLYNILKAKYEFKFDEGFEKNRHFYPLVIQYGLAELEDIDTFELQKYLEEME